MRCKDCPAQIVEYGNESDPTDYYYCFYGEDYLDNHSYRFNDGEDGCYKRLKTIQRDMSDNESDLEKETCKWANKMFDELRFEETFIKMLMKPKEFDATEPDIEITYDGRIPSPFIQK